MWLHNVDVTLVCMLAVVLFCGCGDNPLPADQAMRTPRSEPPRMRVMIVSEGGDFSLVRRDDGQEVYVFTDDVRAESSGGGATHTVAVDTDMFEGNPPPAPRTRGEISWARRQAQRLFLTERTRRRVVGDRLSEIGFVDEQTGERCFVAYVCNNPDCPARADDGQPNLFPQGGSAYSQAFASVQATGHTLGNVCPDCLATRDLQSESDKQRSQYRNWVKRHVLPEERQHRESLDKENRYRIRLLRKDASWTPPR